MHADKHIEFTAILLVYIAYIEEMVHSFRLTDYNMAWLDYDVWGFWMAENYTPRWKMIFIKTVPDSTNDSVL